MRRLSVVDVEGGHQPFANEDGDVWAIQNGELYNHDEMRARSGAPGPPIRTRCDTEIIPHLYEEHGTRFPDQLRGMFGIASGMAASGVRSLRVTGSGSSPSTTPKPAISLVFASELKSVLASGLVRPSSITRRSTPISRSVSCPARGRPSPAFAS